MEETLTKEMKELIAQLGALVKADPRCAAIESTIDAYEHSDELNGMIAEYNTQQNLIADSYTSGEPLPDEVKENIQARINELYTKVTEHPVYVAYLNAKNDFDALTSEIYGELQYIITGQRPCSHDCGSCHADCDHQH